MTTKGNLRLASSLSQVHTTYVTRTSEQTQQDVQAMIDTSREFTRQNLGKVVGFGERETVERPAPGKAPTAFRIWAFGTNVCDGGDVVFSERSAKALIDEQTSRGRLYGFDYDHRSILQSESPEAGRAAGWHRLEVRLDWNGYPELWAVSCEWTEEARAGLESAPPVWRYFSPAYEVDPKTREVLSYTNCALTNNPLTHGIPALASGAGRLALARLKVRELAARSARNSSTKRVLVRGRLPIRASVAGGAAPGAKEALAALRIVADKSAPESAKAKALDVLSAHFEPLIEAELKKEELSAKSSAALDKLRALAARAEKTESASAIAKAARATRPTLSHRPNATTHRPSAMTKDPTVEMIERAQRNTLGGPSKRDATTEHASTVGRTTRELASLAPPNGDGGAFVDVATIERIARTTIAANGR